MYFLNFLIININVTTYLNIYVASILNITFIEKLNLYVTSKQVDEIVVICIAQVKTCKFIIFHQNWNLSESIIKSKRQIDFLNWLKTNYE